MVDVLGHGKRRQGQQDRDQAHREPVPQRMERGRMPHGIRMEYHKPEGGVKIAGIHVQIS
jgi:hypothetical protein